MLVKIFDWGRRASQRLMCDIKFTTCHIHILQPRLQQLQEVTPRALVEQLLTAVRSELNTLEEHSERTAEEQQELCLNDK